MLCNEAYTFVRKHRGFRFTFLLFHGSNAVELPRKSSNIIVWHEDTKSMPFFSPLLSHGTLKKGLGLLVVIWEGDWGEQTL